MLTQSIANPVRPSRRILQPEERISEVLFGLIMVLTFTGSISVAESGREDIRTMLIAALGCNIAWGIIDGVLYLMACMADSGRELRSYRAFRQTNDPQAAQRMIADAMPEVIASVMQPEELAAVHQRLKELPEPIIRPRLTGRDWLGAAGVFLLVFVSTFPVAIPFIFMTNASAAMRISNLIAVTILFIAGYMFGKITGARPLVVGIAMVVIGVVLVAMTIALGG